MTKMKAPERYITRGIQGNLSPHLQQILFSLVDTRDNDAEKNGQKADYLSVFHIKRKDKRHIQIKMLQEQPPYNLKYMIQSIEDFKKSKVYVVREDDIDPFYIMLLPTEY
ncbi:DUF960 family protein [Macrococcus brunensis]|uniref:DUF960 family protein n=1 Tax=Macrococcus brunensis TaxID=198483 RepID=UPI001EF0E481|nr:DUF960 family protein [Macrococcus brunensis]ULG74228.1 DUF960 domain-containing protein [Macrococcus brunensis]